MVFSRSDYIKQKLPIEFELKLIIGKDKKITLFEIGACEGEDSIKYSRFFPKSQIYAFEPLPNNIQLIRDNYEKYSLKNARFFNVALSNQNGFATFYVSTGQPEKADTEDWDFGNKSSSLLPPSKHLETASFINFDKKIEVETKTLKSFCQKEKIDKIDFIHMDVQGAELMVLEGAADFINSIKLIWLEVSNIDLYKNQPLAKDIFDFMKKNKFVLIKNELASIQGDQMYISRNFYSAFKIFFISKLILIRSLLIKLILKMKRKS